MSDNIRTESIEDLTRKIDPDPEILDLRKRLQQYEKRIRDLKHEAGSTKTFFSDIKEYLTTVEQPKQIYVKAESDKIVKSPCIAVAQLTDNHMGAVQEPDEIEGFGAYNPEICTKRVMYFGERFVDWVNVHRLGYTINECVVLCTGDHISGDIHDELRITNAFPSPVQCVEAGLLIANFVSLLASHFDKVRVEFVTEDNHARLVKKPQAKEAGLNTLNYIVGFVAQERLSKLDNVEFNLHPMYQKTVSVNGRNYLITHGHGIRGWSGFPYYGIERKAHREAMKRMLTNMNKFDKIIIGHYHAPMTHPHYWIGASSQGTDAYDHKNGRHADPGQSAWMVHPKYGEFDRTDFFLGNIS